MSKGEVEYRTPVCVMKGLERQFKKIEKGSWQPEPIPLEPEMTYFNNKQTYRWKAEYDHFFAYTKMFPLWDRRKSKCNSVYLPDIHENTFQQEKNKPVPVLTSMEYGRPCRPFYDLQENYCKKNATNDFYRPRGVISEEEKELQHFS